MKRISTTISLFLLGMAHASAAEPELEALKQEAAGITKTFAGGLSENMQAAMKAGGPVSAITTCSEIAPRIAGELSREHGVKLTRVGTRVRNPMLGTPDAWEQTVLAQFQQKLNEVAAMDQLVHAEIVYEPGGKYFRFMKAIGVQPQCLQCHGGDKDIPDEVKASLKAQHPHDKATGYKAGELRGAVTIKKQL
ncbi:MAG: DUF3365 domain-containing protein [Pseudomonadota bacterium]